MEQASAQSNLDGYREAARNVQNAATGDEEAVERLAKVLREAVKESLAEALQPVGKAINTILEVQKNQQGAIKALDDRLADIPSKKQIDTLFKTMDEAEDRNKEISGKLDRIRALYESETPERPQ